VTTFKHLVSQDGLCLTSEAIYDDGNVLTMTVHWDDPEVALAHYELAVTSFESKHERLNSRQPGDRRRVRRFQTSVGTFFVHVNTGPPTWWLPRAGASYGASKGRPDEVLHVRCGWLRGCIVVSWQRSTDRKEME